MSRSGGLALVWGAVAVFAATAPAARAFDPATEALNFSKTQERANFEFDLPPYQALLAQKGAESEVELAQIKATDPERDSSGNLCQQHMNGCAGDVRLWAKDWAAAGHGLAIPVLFTARDGAVISGHVWATRAGPALRPAVVITTGSVQAPEELYAFAATTLAKEGFVVLTYDVQGQGRSDTYGEGADMQEGVPSQSGQPFFDGTEDALDFLYSTPARPYRPRKSCGNANGGVGTDHSAKQNRRVAARLNAAYNPLSQLVDPDRVGVIGHSLGAGAVSYIGQLDPRVKAIIAYDNLRDSGTASAMSHSTCPSGSSPRPNTVPITKPALGMAGDYPLFGGPKTSQPDPEEKNGGFAAYQKAGMDSGEITIRGGDHLDFSYIPNRAFSSTLRGMDLIAWYTSAWMDKYVKGDDSADRQLATARWRNDAQEAAVDPNVPPDTNLFSFYFRSPMDIGRTHGTRFICNNLRPGCPGLMTDDGRPANYSYLAAANTPDSAIGPPGYFGAPVHTAAFSQRVAVRAPRLASDAGTSANFAVRVAAVGVRSATLDHYELEVADASGGSYRTLTSLLGDNPQYFLGSSGRAYSFRARAVGRGGRVGPWAYATTVVPIDEAGGTGRPSFGRGWTTVRSRAAYGGTLRRSTRRGAALTLRFRGSMVYVVGRRTPAGGRALAVLDGRARVLDFSALRPANRAVIAGLRAGGQRRHTLTLTNLHIRGRNGSRGTRVEVDAFGVAP